MPHRFNEVSSPRGLRFQRANRVQRILFVIALTSLVAASCRASVDVIESTQPAAVPTATEVPVADDGPGDPEPAATVDEPDPPAEETSEPEPAPTEAPAAPAAPLFDLRGELPLTTDEVNALIEFIQAETGRDFLRPPLIVAQSAEEFEEGLELDGFVDEAESSVRSLQSLGLTDLGVAEVTTAFTSLLESPEQGIQGYYDTEVDELYVPLAVLGDDDFKGLLVHELTHALDGQHADLSVFDDLVEDAEASGNYEPAAALQAVVEGRATAVQNRWYEVTGAIPPDADPSEISDSVPTALLFEISAPYAFGEQFILSNGGPGNTWDLLENPPITTEEILVQTIGVGVEPVVDVAAPAADGPILEDVSFGSLDLLIWLIGGELEPDPALIRPAFAAFDGWAGGRRVMWGDDTTTCSRIAMAGDSPQDLSEILAAVEIWVATGADRSVVADDELVTVTSCAPYVP